MKKKVLPALKNIVEPLIEPIRKENLKLKAQVAELRSELKEAVMDLEETNDRRMAECDDETRKTNLVVHGLDQSKPESALSTVTAFMNDQLPFEVKPDELSSVEHIGGRNTIVRFNELSKKKEVFTAMKEKEKKGDPVSVKSDYSPRSRRARSQLFQLFLDIKHDNNNGRCSPRLKGGKIAVGDTEFFLHERRGCIEKRVRGRREEFLSIPPSRQPDRRTRNASPRRSQAAAAAAPTRQQPADSDPPLPSNLEDMVLSRLTPERLEESIGKAVQQRFAESMKEVKFKK